MNTQHPQINNTHSSTGFWAIWLVWLAWPHVAALRGVQQFATKCKSSAVIYALLVRAFATKAKKQHVAWAAHASELEHEQRTAQSVDHHIMAHFWRT